MRKYLATLHKRPAHHKKRFSLLVSGGFTLFIFAVWTAATFGTGGRLAQNNIPIERAHKEVGPIESLRSNLSSSLEGLKESFSKLGGGFKSLNEVESGYTEMKDGVLNTYGQ